MSDSRNLNCKAILGPTNTGKTFYAVERMLSYRSGIIGVPLRLLARELYDKIVEIRGVDLCALNTGEEKIIGEKAKYWICTTEAMPLDKSYEFLAVDEIQLCADEERGHIFTERLFRLGINWTAQCKLRFIRIATFENPTVCGSADQVSSRLLIYDQAAVFLEVQPGTFDEVDQLMAAQMILGLRMVLLSRFGFENA